MVNAHRQYAQTQTHTVSQEGLLLLLYEGAIKFLAQARENLETSRIGPGKTALSRALAIVAELQNSLDPEAGWEGSEDLNHLYGFMILELTEANLTNDLDRIDAVRGLLTGLHDAWREAVESQAQPAGEPDPPAGGGETPALRVSA